MSKDCTHSALPRQAGSEGRQGEASWKRGKEGVPMGGWEAVHKVLGRNQVDGLDSRGGTRRWCARQVRPGNRKF